MNIDDLIDPYLARIAGDWIAYFSSPEGVRDDDPNLFNPWGIVSSLVDHDTLLAWDLIIHILDEDVKGSSLGLLSAGPLEDLISKHGHGYIEEIEELARQSPRFRSLLAGVWQLEAQHDVWDRVVAARGDAEPFE